MQQTQPSLRLSAIHVSHCFSLPSFSLVNSFSNAPPHTLACKTAILRPKILFILMLSCLFLDCFFCSSLFCPLTNFTMRKPDHMTIFRPNAIKSSMHTLRAKSRPVHFGHLVPSYPPLHWASPDVEKWGTEMMLNNTLMTLLSENPDLIRQYSTISLFYHRV